MSSRYVLRLVIAVALLAALDQAVPPLIARLEADRYESDRLFRFENSDLFSLGPLAEYLKEHPRGARRRVAFFGDSMIWGYFVKPTETIAAQFQRLEPSVRVLNLGINGFETGSALLMAKAMIESLDVIYVLVKGESAHRNLPGLIDVDPADTARFQLNAPEPLEPRLAGALSFWRLYSDAYRLQAGGFGTSTRLYVYLHKGDVARRLLGRTTGADDDIPVIPSAMEAASTIAIEVARADMAPDRARAAALAAAHPIVWEFATLAKAHRKRAVFLEVVDHSEAIGLREQADLNAWFYPEAKFVRLDIPAILKVDGLHLTPLGSAALALRLSQETFAAGNGAER